MNICLLKGTVKNAFLCKAISSVKIKIYSIENKVLNLSLTDDDGRFQIKIENFREASYITFEKR